MKWQPTPVLLPRKSHGWRSLVGYRSWGHKELETTKQLHFHKSKLWFQTLVLEKTLESPLDWKEIKPVNPKGNQSWVFIGRTDAKAPTFWPPHVNSQLTGKDPDAGKYWNREKKGMTENEMVGWHHWFNGHEFEQTLGDTEGQGSLVCCSSWDHKGSDTTEWLDSHNTWKNKFSKENQNHIFCPTGRPWHSLGGSL